MAMKDLTPFELKLYEFIRGEYDGSQPWVTKDVARQLGTTDDDVYNGLSELTKKIKDNIWIHYKAGSMYIVAE